MQVFCNRVKCPSITFVPFSNHPERLVMKPNKSTKNVTIQNSKPSRMNTVNIIHMEWNCILCLAIKYYTHPQSTLVRKTQSHTLKVGMIFYNYIDPPEKNSGRKAILQKLEMCIVPWKTNQCVMFVSVRCCGVLHCFIRKSIEIYTQDNILIGLFNTVFPPYLCKISWLIAMKNGSFSVFKMNFKYLTLT